MQVGHVAALDGPLQVFLTVAEPDTVLFHDIAGTADGGRSVVAVLGYGIAGGGHDEAGAGGYVEGVLPVAAGTYDVDGAIGRQVDRNASAQQGVAEAQQFVYGDVAHPVDGEQGSQLCVVVVSCRNVVHQPAGFLFAEHFVLEEMGE